MQQLVLATLLCLQVGEPGNGMQLYRDGRFAEAAAAFRAAIERDGDSAELQWNLALASWRAGDLVAAETAAEKYAAMSKDARTDLHAGLLGAVRHAEAKLLEQQADQVAAPPPAAAAPDNAPPDPLPMLEQALQKATQAKEHFVRGAAAKATPELLRNTERSLRTIDELQQKIDELKKQREQQQKDAKKDDKKKDDKNESGEPKPDEKQEPKPDEKQEPKPDEKGEPQQQQQQQPEQPPQGEEKPEPKPGQPDDQPKDAPKDGAKQGGGSGEAPPQAEPKGETGERHDAPGEAREGKELTSEQLQRLLDQLRRTDDKAKEIRLRAKTARRPVERDW